MHNYKLLSTQQQIHTNTRRILTSNDKKECLPIKYTLFANVTSSIYIYIYMCIYVHTWQSTPPPPPPPHTHTQTHYNDVIMASMASQITSLTIVYTVVYSDADKRKHQSSASLAFVWVIHRGPVNSPHKWPVTRKMFPFDDVIMNKNGLYSGCVY